jgi:hypothetical protein
MFLGAKRCGIGIQRRKICLILDREAHRYQKFISDIAGQDIRAHRRQETQAISLTRDWLRNGSGKSIPGGGEIGRQYQRFKTQLPSLCRKLKLRRSEMTFNDYINIVAEWLKERLQIQ